jgi:hypothetical protein
MALNSTRSGKMRISAGSRRNRARSTGGTQFEVIYGRKQRASMRSNQYRCTIERNQNGKYNVRIRAQFGGGSQGWVLPLYFLASSFNAAMKKLEESLQLLQKSEEKLRFWTVERTDDPALAGDLLQEFGLWVDRRREFPRRTGEIAVARERPVPAGVLAPLRRILADAVAQERVPVAAGD